MMTFCRRVTALKYGKRLSNTLVIESKMIHIVYTNTGGLPGLQMIYNSSQILKFPFVINGNFTHTHTRKERTNIDWPEVGSDYKNIYIPEDQ